MKFNKFKMILFLISSIFFLYSSPVLSIDWDYEIMYLVQNTVIKQNKKNKTNYSVSVRLKSEKSIALGIYDLANQGSLVNYYKFLKSNDGFIESVKNIHGVRVDFLEEMNLMREKKENLKNSGRYNLSNRKGQMLFNRELKKQSKEILENIQSKLEAMDHMEQK